MIRMRIASAGLAASVLLIGISGVAAACGATATPLTFTSNHRISSFYIAALHAKLVLPGPWIADPAQAGPIRDQAALAAEGAKISTEVSVRQGPTGVSVVSFPSRDPAAVLQRYVITTPGSGTDAYGESVLVTQSRNVMIDGHTAVTYSGLTRRKNGQSYSFAVIAIDAGKSVVIMRDITTTVDAAHLVEIDKALLAIA